MELFFDERPHGEFDDYGENDDGEAKVADEVVDNEEEVDYGAYY